MVLTVRYSQQQSLENIESQVLLLTHPENYMVHQRSHSEIVGQEKMCLYAWSSAFIKVKDEGLDFHRHTLY